MIELFAHKQIGCKHCGFGFIYTGFGSAAEIVCPACGEANELPPTAPSVSTPPEPVPQESIGEQVAAPLNSALIMASAAPTVPFLAEPAPQQPLPQVTAEKSAPCSVELCPLLMGSESANPAANEITEQLGVRVLKRKKRRKNILAWTVTLQMCVLLGVVLFVAKTYWAKTYWTPETEPAPVAAVKENVSSLADPLEVLPLDLPALNAAALDSAALIPAAGQPAAVEEKFVEEKIVAEKIVSHVPIPNDLPLSPVVQPETIDQMPAGLPDVLPSMETAQDVFPPPVHDYSSDALSPFEVPIAAPIVAPNTLAAQPQPEGETIPPPLPAEPASPPTAPPDTLETADNLMESAKAALAANAETSVEHAVRAAKIYEQLGHNYPDSLYWILGNAFASLSWGEPLLESSPAVKTMTLSPDNRYLLMQLADKTVWLWNLKPSSQDHSGYVLDQGTAEYVKFIFTADLRWIIGGQKNGMIRIWDMSLKNPADSVVTFTERVPDLQDLQISPNGQWLAAFGHAPRSMMLSHKPSKPAVQQVNYQRTDRDPMSSSPYPVLLWNLRQMETGIMPMAVIVPSMPQPVQVVRFSPNSDRIAVGRKDAVVRVYDVTPRGVNEDPFILRGHQLGITQIAFAPSGQWIATGSQDNTVRLWNLTSSKVSPESATLYGHVGWIKTLTIDTTGEYLISGSYDRTIRIWNIKFNRIGTALKEEPIILETSQGIPETLLISPDNDKMIVHGQSGSLGVYHLPSVLNGKPDEELRAIIFRNSQLSISQCQLTSDNQFLIFSYDHLENPANNGIRLWSLQTKSLIP